jgi:hypothetical protein
MRRTPRSIAGILCVALSAAVLTSAVEERRATGGSGTEQDPWTGWEGQLAAGASMRLAAGWYRLSASLVLPAGARLSGEGEQSVVVLGAAGIGIVNAPDAGGIVIERLRILGGAAVHGASATSCIQLSAGAASGFRIEDVSVEDAGQDGILIVGTKGRETDVAIVGCRVEGSRRHGIELRTVRNGRIESSSIRATNRGDLGAAIYAGSDAATEGVLVVDNDVMDAGDNGIRCAGSRVTIERNRISAAGTDGIRLAGDRQECRGNAVEKAEEQGIKVEDGTQVSVEGNTVIACGENGIEVRSTRRQPARIRIVSNTSSGNGGSGLHVFGGDRVLVEGNRFVENAQNGIKVYPDAGRRVRNVTLARNELRAGPPGYDGILIGGAGDLGGIVVRDNVLDGRSAWRHGIHVARGGAVRVMRNEIRGTREAPTAQPAARGTR